MEKHAVNINGEKKKYYFFFRKAGCQRNPVILIKQIVLWEKINENIIIVAATLICTSVLLCVHGVEQLRFDCFYNEQYLWGKLAVKPVAVI